MAYSSWLYFGICFLVFFHGGFAEIEMVTNQHQQQEQPQHRFSRQSECQFQNLNALQPKHRFRSEAGETEFWDQNEQQFQCAGVAFLRHKIQRRGLLLPSFTNAPMLMYIVQGEGIQGAIFPGCAETFQSLSQQRSSPDQHQKMRRFKEGDVIALPAGVSHWIYNNGQSQLVLVALVDVGSNDQNFRKFFLAGNPQEGLIRGGQQWQRKSYRGRHQEEEEEHQLQESGGNNLLSGFDENLLEEVFKIETRLARKLQNKRDNRGAIVRVEHEIQSPETAEDEQREQGREEEEEEAEEKEGHEMA